MKELIEIMQALENEPTRIGALATLVSVQGSSYRRIGARMLWLAGQKDEPAMRIGSISGGCLEEDLTAHCREVVDAGVSRVVVYDTTSENDLVWGVGLGCKGVVHVLAEPVCGLPAWMAKVKTAWAQNRDVVMAIPFGEGEKSEKGRVLSRVIVAAEALDGADDDPLVREAGSVLAERRSVVRVLELDGQEQPVCFNYLPPPVSLVVFGAGDDVRPLVQMAANLGWQVRVVDSREHYATKARFPDAVDVIAVSAGQACTHRRVTPYLHARAFVVVMTHRYADDLPLLRALLSMQLAYLGLLGPRKRAEQIFAELGVDGASALRTHLHAPVGLDLGGDTPESVALSILAEMRLVLSQQNGESRDGRPLRERISPIHLESSEERLV